MSCGASLLLLATMKQNIAGVLILGISVVPWFPAMLMLGGFYWFMANLEQKPAGEASLYLPVIMAV